MISTSDGVGLLGEWPHGKVVVSSFGFDFFDFGNAVICEDVFFDKRLEEALEEGRVGRLGWGVFDFG